MFRTEELLRALDSKRFNHVDVVATTIPALAGIAFSVFIGQHTALRFHHGRVGEILRGDELDMALLAVPLGSNGCSDFGVDHVDRVGVEGGIGVCGGHGKHGKRLKKEQLRKARPNREQNCAFFRL